MTRHDEDVPEPGAGSQPPAGTGPGSGTEPGAGTGAAGPPPSGSGMGESTGTWAFISPFAASPDTVAMTLTVSPWVRPDTSTPEPTA